MQAVGLSHIWILLGLEILIRGLILGVVHRIVVLVPSGGRTWSHVVLLSRAGSGSSVDVELLVVGLLDLGILSRITALSHRSAHLFMLVDLGLGSFASGMHLSELLVETPLDSKRSRL